jgi:hypothetical protein
MPKIVTVILCDLLDLWHVGINDTFTPNGNAGHRVSSHFTHKVGLNSVSVHHKAHMGFKRRPYEI